MATFPELVAPIQTKLDSATAELDRLELARKTKKQEIRGLTKMLRQATGDGREQRAREREVKS